MASAGLTTTSGAARATRPDAAAAETFRAPSSKVTSGTLGTVTVEPRTISSNHSVEEPTRVALTPHVAENTPGFVFSCTFKVTVLSSMD